MIVSKYAFTEFDLHHHAGQGPGFRVRDSVLDGGKFVAQSVDFGIGVSGIAQCH